MLNEQPHTVGVELTLPTCQGDLVFAKGNVDFKSLKGKCNPKGKTFYEVNFLGDVKASLQNPLIKGKRGKNNKIPAVLVGFCPRTDDTFIGHLRASGWKIDEEVRKKYFSSQGR